MFGWKFSRLKPELLCIAGEKEVASKTHLTQLPQGQRTRFSVHLFAHVAPARQHQLSPNKPCESQQQG